MLFTFHRFSGTLVMVLSVALVLHTLAPSVLAMPQGGRIAHGEGTIHVDGTTMTVAQVGDRLAIYWDGFDIGAGETVAFLQPDSSSVALNRVTSLDPSELYGQLQANGQVFLINPNGIIFGQGARVDAGGFVASTLDLHDDDFLAGRYNFVGTGTGGAIVNDGAITAAPGGYVALLGRTVANDGEIHASGGNVTLAAGDVVALHFGNAGLFQAIVDAAAVDAQIRNGGLIAAAGGQVQLTARAKDALLETVINHTGIIKASTLEERGGVILLGGGWEGGTVAVDGKLDVSSAAGEGGEIRVDGYAVHLHEGAFLDARGGTSGGFVETSGARVTIEDGARVTTLAHSGSAGTWLIDPSDYVVGPLDPGDGSSYMSHTTLSTSLDGGHVEIATVAGAGGSGLGSIFINGPVSWSAATTLTLRAHNDVEINDAVVGSDSGSALTILAGKNDPLVSGTTGNVTLDESAHISVGTLTIGANPDEVNAGFGERMGTIDLRGQLGVDLLDIDRSHGGIISFTADNAGNAIGTLRSTDGPGHVGLIRVHDGAGGLGVLLEIDGGETAGIFIRTAGNLTLQSGTSLSFMPNPVDLIFVADGGAFINEAGSGAFDLDPSQFQRFLIYSSDPETTQPGGLIGTFTYGKTYDADHQDYLTNDGISRFLYAPSDVLTLIFIADDKNRVYGDANPTFTWTVAGLADGEEIDDVVSGGDPALSTTAVPASNIGIYTVTITGAGLTSSKYAFQFQDGHLTVNPAPVTLTVGNATREYGESVWDAPPSVAAGVGDLKLGHTVDDLNLTFNYNTDPTFSVANLPTSISASIGNNNYTLAGPALGELTITKAALLGTINTVERVYGEAIHGPSAIFNDIDWTGLKNGENPIAAVSVNFDDQLETGVGNYVLDGVASAVNYDVTLAPGVLRIIPAQLDVVISAAEREYGDANPAFSATPVNLKSWDTFADEFSGLFQTAATATSGVGTYAITLVDYDMPSGNYVLRNVDEGLLTVAPAPLTGQVGDIQRLYGDVLTNAELQAAVNGIAWTGLKNGEGGGVVSVALSDLAQFTHVGAYDFAGEGSAANYAVTLVPGTLTITPAPLTIDVDDLVLYVGDSPVFTYKLIGVKGDDQVGVVNLEFVTTAPNMQTRGVWVITPHGGTSDSPNYQVTGWFDGELRIADRPIQFVHVDWSDVEIITTGDFDVNLDNLVIDIEIPDDQVRVLNTSQFSPGYVDSFLTSSRATMGSALKRAFDSDVFTGEDQQELRTYLSQVVAGQRSYEAWMAEIHSGSTVAKAAFAAVLPSFTLELMEKPASALTTAETYYLEMVGERVAQRRSEVAARTQEKLTAFLDANTGLTSLFANRVQDMLMETQEEMAAELERRIQQTFEVDAAGSNAGRGAATGGAVAGGVTAGVISAVALKSIMPYVAVKAGLELGRQIVTKITATAAGTGVGIIVAIGILIASEGLIQALESQANLDAIKHAISLADEQIGSARDLLSGGFSEIEMLEVSLATLDLLAGGTSGLPF